VNSESKGGPAQTGGPQDAQDPAYRYQDSGIQERHGHVPLWLWVVVVLLTVWAVYYLIYYWSPPP
jgi:hypothetical protein